MPLLENGSPAELGSKLSSLSAGQVKRYQSLVEASLLSRSVDVRKEAAKALGRARSGERALRQRLSEERNEIVLTDITESLAACRDTASVTLIQELIACHPSSLVRSYAALALGDILKEKSVAFLRDRLTHERSTRAKATMLCVLFVYGATDVLSTLLSTLRSKDSATRGGVANLLAHYAPKKKRKEIVLSLRNAAAIETKPGILGDIEKAIGVLAR